MNRFRYCLLLQLLAISSIFAQGATKVDNIKEFIPEGFTLLDKASGNLNKDSYSDLVLVLQTKNKATEEDEVRPLILLRGTASGKYKLLARNDSVVLCKGCGGVFGDPYDGITIKNGYFSIEHYVGSSWRWTRIITFKYDLKCKNFILHKDAGVSYHNTEEEMKFNSIISNKDKYGKQLFTEFRNDI